MLKMRATNTTLKLIERAGKKIEITGISIDISNAIKAAKNPSFYQLKCGLLLVPAEHCSCYAMNTPIICVMVALQALAVNPAQLSQICVTTLALVGRATFSRIAVKRLRSVTAFQVRRSPSTATEHRFLWRTMVYLNFVEHDRRT